MSVEFVFYSGVYPHLCFGDLTVAIDGNEVTFHCLRRSGPPYIVMSSGGECCFNDDFEEEVTSGPWHVTVSAEYREYEREIERVVNENVRWGCCGGCL